MTANKLRDPAAKRLGRAAYAGALSIHGVLSAATSGGGRDVRVFYGGARGGDVGGPLVKVKRLQTVFPEHRWRYNIVYSLSNAPYLPRLALAALKRRRVPVVHNQNGVFYAAWYGGDWRAANRRMAAAYHLADHVFYQSEFCRRAADHFLGRRHGPGETLYNAVDTTAFTPAGDDGNRRPFTFLLTGKIDSHLFYRIEGAMRGLAAARGRGLEARLVIAGRLSPAAKASTADLAAGLGIGAAVDVAGSYSQTAAPGIYRAADAYVMTKHNDPCPNTVIEAMASGLPVIYSHSGGVPELVGAECGVALPCPADWQRARHPEPEAIAEAMLAVAAGRNAMAAAARQRAVARFDLAAWTARHGALFESLLERGA